MKKANLKAASKVIKQMNPAITGKESQQTDDSNGLDAPLTRFLPKVTPPPPPKTDGILALSVNIFRPHLEKCEEHGKYQKNQIVDGVERWTPDCPICLRDRDIKLMMGRALIPKRFLQKTLDNYKWHNKNSKTAWGTANEYATAFELKKQLGTSLIFCGNSGTGKTHLACGIANLVMQKKHSALFTMVSEMVKMIRRSYNNKTLDEIEQINKFANIDLLILDEVGVQRGTDDEKLLIFEVLNKRYVKMKPTILISNFTPKEIEEYLGTRIFDRLREGGGRMVIFDWESYRGKV